MCQVTSAPKRLMRLAKHSLLIGVMLVSMSCQHGRERANDNYVFKVNYNIQPLDDSADYEALLSSLDGFLKTKNSTTVENAYWLPEDYKRHYQPFWPLVGIEANQKLNDTNYFKPTVLDIVRLDTTGQLQVKIAFMGVDSTGRCDLRAIYNVMAVKAGRSYRFGTVFERNLSKWKKMTVGRITYVYKDELNLQLAREMDKFNEQFAERFHQEPITFTYYKCADPVELYCLYGFDYTPAMYLAPTGGRWVMWDTAFFAANNSEWYPRELVAYYLVKIFGGQTNEIIREGYATYIAGTTGRSLDEVLKIVASFYRSHPDRKILVDLEEGYRIQGFLYLVYPIGGLICREVEVRSGSEGIRRLFQIGNGEDGFYRAVDSLLGVSRSQLEAFLRRKLNESP